MVRVLCVFDENQMGRIVGHERKGFLQAFDRVCRNHNLTVGYNYLYFCFHPFRPLFPRKSIGSPSVFSEPRVASPKILTVKFAVLGVCKEKRNDRLKGKSQRNRKDDFFGKIHNKEKKLKFAKALSTCLWGKGSNF
ncbi:hypothetical protein GMAR_ORF44 [Golden Marseillevirus]|uniref:hypothetical protein n=1 Tax=Golden Marseillevirus TaxID=1720526 RepID=UPI000877AE71|nr:hypothetical protein GMAR_ORF44 [Golden Marseillevirus]ALX27419.1 hypothetical protein GMAR_ORF44 [Golden Marseillevirus]